MPKVDKRKNTLKQQKFIKLVLANLGNQKSSKTLGEIVLEAGYSESMAKNPYQIFESKTIKEGLKEFTDLLDDKRRMAITRITGTKLDKSSAKDLAQIVDALTKNHQLLTGGATSREGMTDSLADFYDRVNKKG